MRLHNRQVKAAFWEDPKLMRLPRDARTLFHGLWHLADDSGCLEYDTFAFKTFLFRSPLDDDMTIERIGELTVQLIHVELLLAYEAARKQCLFVRNFHKHQSLRSPAPPEVPLPPWITWIPSEKAQRSGTYEVHLPDTEGDGEHTETVRQPYGDLTEAKGNQARARNEPEPEPEKEPLLPAEGEEGAPAAHSSSTSGEQETWIKWHERRFAILPTRAAMQEYARLTERGVSDDLIIEGIERSLKSKGVKAAVPHALTVIGGWFAQGIKTKADLERYEAEQAKEGDQPAFGDSEDPRDRIRREREHSLQRDDGPPEEEDDPIAARARAQLAALREATQQEKPEFIKMPDGTMVKRLKSTDEVA
jgi:hypothetical protein